MEEIDGPEITLAERYMRLRPGAKKHLQTSWPQAFADGIFARIDEKLFAPLYPDPQDPPDTDIAILAGALILRELYDASDELIYNAVLFDLRFAYALHTEKTFHQPTAVLYEDSLFHFRRRCWEYELRTGTCLLRECIAPMGEAIGEVVRKRDGDYYGFSMKATTPDKLLEGIRLLSRAESLAACIAGWVERIPQEDPSTYPIELLRYENFDSNFNHFYRLYSSVLREPMKILLEDANRLLGLLGEEDRKREEYRLLLQNMRDEPGPAGQ